MKLMPAAFVPILALLGAACSAGGDGSGGPSGPSAGPTSPTPDGAATATGGVALPPENMLGPVRRDAATRAAVLEADVTVVSSAEVQWSDGSLGCPQPGMMYTQALVDGHRIIVRAGGREFDYRVTGPGRFRICGRP